MYERQSQSFEGKCFIPQGTTQTALYYYYSVFITQTALYYYLLRATQVWFSPRLDLVHYQSPDKVNEAKKFSIVVYGIKEFSKGSPRLAWFDKDVKEVTEIIHMKDPEFSSQSVFDCTRLGKYSTESTGSILVKLSRGSTWKVFHWIDRVDTCEVVEKSRSN